MLEVQLTEEGTRLDVSLRCHPEGSKLLPTDLHRLGLISKSDALRSKLDFVSGSFAQYHLPWMDVIATESGISLSTTATTRFESLGDVVAGIVTSSQALRDLVTLRATRHADYAGSAPVGAGMRLVSVIDQDWLPNTSPATSLASLRMNLRADQWMCDHATVLIAGSRRDGCWLHVSGRLQWDLPVEDGLTDRIERVFGDWPRRIGDLDQIVDDYASYAHSRVGIHELHKPGGDT